MKVPGTNFDLRVYEPSEKIEMIAHSADCRYCNGIVKMMRDAVTFKLQPENCVCLMCGQPYHVKIPGTIEEWELEQWRQKGQTFSMAGDICPRNELVTKGLDTKFSIEDIDKVLSAFKGATLSPLVLENIIDIFRRMNT